jgi:hypothetical protein
MGLRAYGQLNLMIPMPIVGKTTPHKIEFIFTIIFRREMYKRGFMKMTAL